MTLTDFSWLLIGIITGMLIGLIVVIVFFWRDWREK